MRYLYASVFAPQIQQYLDLLTAAERYTDKIKSSLRGLDKYLTEKNLTQKVLTAETISAWVKTRNVSSSTKAADISHINGFVKYLTSLGVEASCPELPRTRSSYVPYIFSDAEFERIISVADNFEAAPTFTRSALIFPILLRLLYGCGLRLGEGLALRWKDVDIENGVLTIMKAKNRKQRFVPIDDSVIVLLQNYKTMILSDDICGDYLFENRCIPGRPFSNRSFGVWFRHALKAAGIHYTKNHNHERGPCPHCLRHGFTLKSFLKSENGGRRFEDTAPFLAAYLGHEDSRGTETYLSTNHSLYTQSHKRVDISIGHLFPEVSFNEN